ncbi:hypothetical protein PCLA_17f0132 [Pseudomonas citronellolis]|nr:hypothetical protein PCLA_17f0132 [Pseudomonas citronellolis]
MTTAQAPGDAAGAFPVPAMQAAPRLPRRADRRRLCGGIQIAMMRTPISRSPPP